MTPRSNTWARRLMALYMRFLAALLAISCSTFAEPIQVRPGKPLLSSSGNLAPGLFATPFATDWNGDGRKDLLVGYQNASKIAVYLNSGTDSEPVFTTGFNLQYFDGLSNVWRDINHPSAGCGAPAPWACDFDADGKRDLLVGAGHDGRVWFYRNINTDAQPQLTTPVQLRSGNGFVDVSSRANPVFHDWDEDGLPDLIVGAGDGFVYFFRNTNTLQTPGFAPKLKIQAGGTDLILKTAADGRTSDTPRSVPRIADWDGDGLKDLVCGSDAGAFWCRNTGDNSVPRLEAPVALYCPTPRGFAPLLTGPVPGARMRAMVTDWNGDNVLDLLIGNADGTTYYYEGYHFGLTGIVREPQGALMLKWNSSDLLSYDILIRDPGTATETIAVTNVPSGGRTTTYLLHPNGGAGEFYRVRATMPR